MDFALNDAQQRWHEAAIAFAREELRDEAMADRDARGEFWREGYRRCARFGAPGLPVPREHGGQAQDAVTTVAVMEGLGYGGNDSGLIFALNASLWTITMPILEFGTEDQKRRWLPGLCDGTLFAANAASEPGSGSDIFSMQTRAERRGDGWVLNGRKIWITGAPVADLFVAFATTDPSRGVMGITAFIIPQGTPGLNVVRTIDKMGTRTAPFGEVAFEGCELPAEALLGREGRGSRIFNAALEWERGAILAFALGVMRRQLERCIEHARKRTQFGQSIGKFQAVSHRIAEMALRLETSRLMAYRFAWIKDRKVGDAASAAAMAKLHISECFVQNSLDAVRIFGARGYTVEDGLERDLRDSIGAVLFSGTNDIQRSILAQHLRI